MRALHYRYLGFSALMLLTACAPPDVAPDKEAPAAGTYSLRRIEIAYLGTVLRDETDPPIAISNALGQNWPQNFLPVLEAQLTSSKSFPQMPKADCLVDTFDRKGREFTASGQCRTRGVRLGTRFVFSGSNTEDAFTILVTMFPEEEGVTNDSRRLTIRGARQGG